MRNMICRLRSEGLSGPQVLLRINIEFPDYPISLGGVYHVERVRKGIHREKREPVTRIAPISLAGPSWSVPKGYAHNHVEEAA
jgi:hypothetical protein